MDCLQSVDGNRYKYSHIIGTGGIGSGMYFNLEGNHTMGRNESRPGVLLPSRDYCKLHIILHYISVLLCGGRDEFSVYPIGSVGDDTIGRNLTAEMSKVGMDIRNIAVLPGVNTLFSICYQASVLSSEVREFEKKGGFENTDLLCVNIDEAGAICGLNPETSKPVGIVESCMSTLRSKNTDIKLVVTDGPRGCYGCSNDSIEYIPVCEVDAKGTGGAGDALVSGVVSGLCCGLPFLKGNSDAYFSQTPLKSAVEFGSLLAAVSVTSPDSIHMGINTEYLFNFIKKRNLELSSEFSRLFPAL